MKRHHSNDLCKGLQVLFALLIASLPASAQWKLEINIDNGSGAKASSTVVWTKDCEARTGSIPIRGEAVDGEPEMYMIMRECGRTVIAVSPSMHSAMKLPFMQSSPAPDVNTGALFMQGTPRVDVQKLEEKPGDVLLGRPTTYFHFKVTYTPDPNVVIYTPEGKPSQVRVVLVANEEFWVDLSVEAPAVDQLLGKAPLGGGDRDVSEAFSKMKGLPLRHRRTVTVERDGVPQATPPFTQEVVALDHQPIPDDVFTWPKDYKYIDTSAASQ